METPLPSPYNCMAAMEAGMEAGEKIVGPAVFYLAGIFMAIGFAIIGATALRRHYRRAADDPASGLTLGQVRQMMADGRISEQEFHRLKHVIVRSATKPVATRSTTCDKLFQGPAAP